MKRAEREQLQRRLEAHLRCSERFPRRRTLHLMAAAHCAEMLGFDLYGPPPPLPPDLQRMADRIHRGLAAARVRQTRQTRICTICRESICSRDLYLDLTDYKLCNLCGKKYGGHIGAWKRGARYQLLP